MPRVVRDVSNRYEGRTIVMTQEVVMPEGALNEAQLNPPDPGVQAGLESVDVRVSDGVATITWTFRTMFDAGGEAGGGGNDSQGNAAYYELDGSTSQEPIASHPNYPELFTKYGLEERDGEPVWRMEDPDGTSGGGGLTTPEGKTLSPMFGVKDYFAANGVYKETRYYRGLGAIPNDLVSKCGKIDDPASLDASGVKGRWLRCGASVRQMGDSYQVTTMWMASQSATNLWKKEIYG